MLRITEGLIGGGFWFSLLTLSYAQPTLYLNDRVLGETINKPVRLNIHGATVDDYVMAVGDAADVNILADATEFPARAGEISSEGQLSFGALMLDLTNEHKLTWQPVDQRTCLMWTDPNIITLARRIANGEPLPLPAKVPDHRVMEQLFTAYLKQNCGWDGFAADFQKQIKLADLPPQLSALVTASVLNEQSDPQELEHWKAWFTDPFWRRAKLRLRTAQVAGQPVDQIEVVGYIDPGGVSGMYLCDVPPLH